MPALVDAAAWTVFWGLCSSIFLCRERGQVAYNSALTATYTVTYMDGVVETVPGVGMLDIVDGRLILYGPSIYGQREHIVTIIMSNVRKYTKA